MNEQRKLTMQMAIFFLIVFVTFGTIIVKEKSTTLFLPKIESSINEYITDNYSSLNVTKGKVTYKDDKYTMKVTDKFNKNLYFYVTYSNKKITDTYEKDYLKGQSIITYLNKKIETSIKEKTNKTYKVEINNTYNNFSTKVKETLNKEQNLESLKIYTLKSEITTSWNTNTITKHISATMTTLNSKNITPKNYSFTITDKTDITKSVIINNLTYELVKNNTLTNIINDIINNEKTTILSDNKITYEYLN